MNIEKCAAIVTVLQELRRLHKEYDEQYKALCQCRVNERVHAYEGSPGIIIDDIIEDKGTLINEAKIRVHRKKIRYENMITSLEKKFDYYIQEN